MLYDYACPSCGSEATRVNRIAERRTNAPDCCGQKMNIVIKTAPMGFVDREIHYECVATGEKVTSRRQRNEIMARENLVDANDIIPSHKQRMEKKRKWDEKIAGIKSQQAEAEKHMAPVQRDMQEKFLRELK